MYIFYIIKKKTTLREACKFHHEALSNDIGQSCISLMKTPLIGRVKIYLNAKMYSIFFKYIKLVVFDITLWLSIEINVTGIEF